MTDYTIEEVGYFNCETCGYLTVSFRLEGDPEETYRTLETDEYYNCAEKESNTHGEYHTKEWDEGDFEDGSYYSHFDLTEWMEYEHDEEKVIEFIYDNYELEILPKPELQ